MRTKATRSSRPRRLRRTRPATARIMAVPANATREYSTSECTDALPEIRPETLLVTFEPTAPIPPNRAGHMTGPEGDRGEADPGREDHAEEHGQSGELTSPHEHQAGARGDHEERRELMAFRRKDEDHDDQRQQDNALNAGGGAGRQVATDGPGEQRGPARRLRRDTLELHGRSPDAPRLAGHAKLHGRVVRKAYPRRLRRDTLELHGRVVRKVHPRRLRRRRLGRRAVLDWPASAEPGEQQRDDQQVEQVTDRLGREVVLAHPVTDGKHEGREPLRAPARPQPHQDHGERHQGKQIDG